MLMKTQFRMEMNCQKKLSEHAIKNNHNVSVIVSASIESQIAELRK